MSDKLARRGSLVVLLLSFSFIVGCGAGGTGGGGGAAQGDDGRGDGGGTGHPDVTSTNPTDGAANVAVDATVSITFVKSAVPDTIDGGVTPDIAFELNWSADNTTVSVTPSVPFAPGTTYTVTVDELQFSDGSALTSAFSLSFTIAGVPDDDYDDGDEPMDCSDVEGEGRTIYVSTEIGDDANDGLAPDRPVATITRGAEIVHGGDELVIAPGTYYERPVFENLCSSADRPVWIRADPRGEATISGMWREAVEGLVSWQDEGDGVYSAQHSEPVFAVYNETFLFRLNSLAELQDSRASAIGVQLPPYGFAAEDGRVYVKLPDGVDPNGKSILLSPPGWGNSNSPTAVMEFQGSPNVIVDGLRIEGSGTCGMFFSPDSTSPTVRNTVFSYCVVGLKLPDSSIVEWCEYVYPGFHDFAEQVRLLNGGQIASVYQLVKEYHDPVLLEGGLAHTYGPGEPASRDCEFRYNFLHETVDGEKLGDFEFSESHHNVYLYNYDNHTELESWAGFGARELRLHDSLFLASPMGPISHQGSEIVGPHYVYRNVFYGFDEHGWPSWTQVKSQAPNATEGIYYYHNVLWGDSGELFWESDNLHFRNNLIIFAANDNVESGSFDGNYNLLVNDTDKPWIYGQDGAYLGDDPETVQFLDVARLNFGIREGSPAENTGMDLPGFNDGAPNGPDIGPFEVGQNPGQEWPRPRTTVFTD